MPSETKGLKLAVTSEKEILSLLDILNEIESINKYELCHTDLIDIDFSEYPILGSFRTGSNEEFIEDLFDHFSNIHHQRILFNCMTMLENCADPDQDTLEYNPRIKKALDLLEETEKVQAS